MIRLPQSWFSWWLSRDSLIWLKVSDRLTESPACPKGSRQGVGLCDSEDVEVSHNLATSPNSLLLIWCGHSRDRDSLGQYVREVRRMTMTMMMMMIRMMVMTVMSVTRASSLDCGHRPGWFSCNNTHTGSHTTCLAPAQVCDGHKVKQKKKDEN